VENGSFYLLLYVCSALSKIGLRAQCYAVLLYDCVEVGDMKGSTGKSYISLLFVFNIIKTNEIQ